MLWNIVLRSLCIVFICLIEILCHFETHVQNNVDKWRCFKVWAKWIKRKLKHRRWMDVLKVRRKWRQSQMHCRHFIMNSDREIRQQKYIWLKSWEMLFFPMALFIGRKSDHLWHSMRWCCDVQQTLLHCECMQGPQGCSVGVFTCGTAHYIECCINLLTT